nr:reverse transcriptase domain-containing protein [Tanacetum cinerariifolium]
MRTRSSSNLVGESSPNPTSLNPKRHNRRHSKKPFIPEESPVDTMADQRTMAKLLRAPTEGYAEAIVVPPIIVEHFELKHSLINMMTSDQFFRLEKEIPHDHICWFNKITSTIKYKDVPNSGQLVVSLKKNPRVLFSLGKILFPNSSMNSSPLKNDKSSHHGFHELHQLDTFYNALNPAVQDSLNSATGSNLLERRTQDVLTIIENKFKVRNSRNKSIVSQVKSSDANSSSSSEIAKLIHAVNQQTSAVTTDMTAILKQFQATPPPGFVKAVEEICVTCGAVVNYNQGNSGYRPLSVANQIRPPGFAQPNVQNNQNRFSQPQRYNRGNNFNQDSSYQAPMQKNQVVPISKLEKIKKINEINIKSMQTQINNVKYELKNEMKTLIQASMFNQTNALKNMMASFFQMNTASTSGSGPLPSNTVANQKGKSKAITTQSCLVLDGPSVLMPPPFINPKEDERVEETLTGPELGEFTIKVPPPLVQKAKPPSKRNYVVHQRDPLHPNIPYPSRMHKQKQQDKDEIQIHKFWQMFKQLHINFTLADALILIPKYQKMFKALLSNKDKLLELENTPLNENCSAVILKKLPKKLKDPGKFLIPFGFSEFKYKAISDLGASINLMPLSIWKKLGLPELISTRMTLELANRAICTPAGIARDVFVLVGNFTFPANFVIVDYESDLRVSLVLERPFLWTARTLIDVHEEEMIFCDGDERLTFNMRHDTLSYSNQPQKESINTINIYDDSCEDYLEDLFATNHLSGNPTFSSHTDLTSPEVIDPLSGSTTFSSSNHLLEEFTDELALITFLSRNDDLPFDIESDFREIECLFNRDPTKEMESILKDSVDEDNLVDPNDNLVDTIPEMFTDEHARDYSSPPLYDDFDDDLVELYDFLPSPEYDSFLFEDFFEFDALPLTNNKDKVFNLSILIHENLFEVTNRVAPDKNVKKIAISHASLILKDFNPTLYELPFHKEVLGSETLLSFSSKNEGKVFKPEILTSKGVHIALLLELSHWGPKAFKVIKIFESPMEIFPCSFREDIRNLISQILKIHARGFVLRLLDLRILSFILGIQYPNLID